MSAVIKFDVDRKCKDGFIASFEQYAGHLNCPSDFHRWTALSLLANALGRRCWSTATLQSKNLYPNLFVCLVGPSAVGKGIALWAARDVLNESIGNHINTFAQKITPEAMIDFLQEKFEEVQSCEGLIFAPEFSTFIGRANIDPTLTQLLTDLYDCPPFWNYRTKGRGNEEIRNVCLNLMAASTPEWIKTSLPEESVGGGFTSRFLFINRQEVSQRKAFSYINQDQMQCRTDCVIDLQKIAKLDGEFQWDNEAKDIYAQWYEEMLPKEIKEAGPNLDGYFGRKATFVAKLAMLYSVNFGDSMIIGEDDIAAALTDLIDNELHLKRAMKFLVQTETGKRIDRVRKIIRKKGTVNHSDLMRGVSNQLNAEELREIISTLDIGKEIKVDTGNKGKLIYHWNKGEI